MTSTQTSDPSMPILYRPQEGLLGVVVTTCIIMPFFWWARLYGRKFQFMNLRADDYVLFASSTIAIASSILTAIVCMYGLGYHTEDMIRLKPEWLPICLKLYFYITNLFPIVTGLTKVSVCLTYRRIFPGRSDHRYAHTLLVLLPIFSVAGLVLAVVRCIPISGYWKRGRGEKCTKGNLISYQALNVMTDFAVFLWPIRTLTNMCIPLRKRIPLMLVFFLGSIASMAGIARIVIMGVYFGTHDLPYFAYRALAAGITEVNVGVMCACITGWRGVAKTVKKWTAQCITGAPVWHAESEIEGSSSSVGGHTPSDIQNETTGLPASNLDVNDARERKGEVSQYPLEK